MPQFAVVIPLYNKAPYVRHAVESVLAQTCADWELWVVDDGSTDGSAEAVETFHDPRIHLHRQANAGVSAARNRGVALSGEGNRSLSGEEVFRSPAAPPFVCFLDADDWWEPTFLEEMQGLIARHPDAGIYGTSYYIVKNGRRRIAPIGFDEGFGEGEINYCQVYAQTLCMPLWTGAVCIPRTVFNAEGRFTLGVKLGEDFLLWVHIALHHKVVSINKSLANYNQDVDITYRGTHHLHRPEDHMLWHLQDLAPFEHTNPDYKLMIDRLRCYDLLPYHLDSRYRDAAAEELAKVDWTNVDTNYQKLYSLPIWIVRIRQVILTIGSQVKQTIIKWMFRQDASCASF